MGKFGNGAPLSSFLTSDAALARQGERAVAHALNPRGLPAAEASGFANRTELPRSLSTLDFSETATPETAATYYLSHSHLEAPRSAHLVN